MNTGRPMPQFSCNRWSASRRASACAWPRRARCARRPEDGRTSRSSRRSRSRSNRLEEQGEQHVGAGPWIDAAHGERHLHPDVSTSSRRPACASTSTLRPICMGQLGLDQHRLGRAWCCLAMACSGTAVLLMPERCRWNFAFSGSNGSLLQAREVEAVGRVDRLVVGEDGIALEYRALHLLAVQQVLQRQHQVLVSY